MPEILLVDDDEPTARLIRLTLSLEGCNVRACQTADEALVAAREQMPDLVISDYLMPGLDVVSFVQQLRGDGFEGSVLLCTAFDGPINVPSSTLLKKPFDPNQLASTVKSLLGVKD
ncbi:MAG TPA: response regulator [Dehalococcoidia bacterium]|nr:response regulator [Dehalococcoidia bacterium]